MAVSANGVERTVAVLTYCVLFAAGFVLGMIETFLVPLRLFGGVEGLSVMLALVGTASLGSLGGIGTRSAIGVVAPVLGWFAAVGLLMMYAPGGDIVVPGKLPADPGVVYVGIAQLLAGLFGGGIAMVVTMRYTRRAITPTPTG